MVVLIFKRKIETAAFGYLSRALVEQRVMKPLAMLSQAGTCGVRATASSLNIFFDNCTSPVFAGWMRGRLPS
jgi:hypothetical protein